MEVTFGHHQDQEDQLATRRGGKQRARGGTRRGRGSTQLDIVPLMLMTSSIIKRSKLSPGQFKSAISLLAWARLAPLRKS